MLASNLADSLLETLKNNRVIAIIIVVATIMTGLHESAQNPLQPVAVEEMRGNYLVG